MSRLNHRQITELMDDYDVFLFDLWGVIVEGGVAYAGVIERINEIIKQKKVYFVSNAPRPDYRVHRNLVGLGLENVTPEMVVTSGDVARRIIDEAKLTGKGDDIGIYHLGSDRNDDILHNINHRSTNSIDESDILLLSVYRDEHEDIHEFNDLLKEAGNKNIMTICSNPDTTIPKHGVTRYCAGHFASIVEQHGGNVIYTGKPKNEIYKVVFQKEPNVAKNRILMIGDTLETDILGGQSAGIHSALVLTGNSGKIHDHEDDLGKKLDLISREAEKREIHPTIITTIS